MEGRREEKGREETGRRKKGKERGGKGMEGEREETERRGGGKGGRGGKTGGKGKEGQGRGETTLSLGLHTHFPSNSIHDCGVSAGLVKCQVTINRMIAMPLILHHLHPI